MNNNIVIPAVYLPPISLFSKVISTEGAILFEKHEHFPKQTYRTRATIHSANGKLDLIVPVKKGNLGHTKMKDVKISYEFGWQRLHWLSLQTSYRRSAFFEYYEDDFVGFYDKQYEFLLDYNLELFQLILRLLKIERQICFTETFQADYLGSLDLRNEMDPKKDHNVSEQKSYYQVFEDKNGFIPHLSIVDLLFNQGPQSKRYL